MFFCTCYIYNYKERKKHLKNEQRSRDAAVQYGCAEVWMTILGSGWNLWVWLVGAVSRRWVWLVGGIYEYGYNV